VNDRRNDDCMKRTPLAIAVFKDGRRRFDIAAAAKIAPSHLSQILNGRRQPGINIALRLASVLGVDVAELFNDNK